MTQLPKEAWNRVQPYLDQALEMDADARSTWLARLRSEDSWAAGEVERFLGEDDRLSDEPFLPGLEGVGLPAVVVPIGERIGAYEIVRQIGFGGMGSVWLARRADGRFESEVAIKLLNLSLLGAGHGGEERFRREGQVLARLTHPNIARLLDAGVAGTRQPYLVLEYVDGRPIDRYADEERLTVPERLALMLQVMDAVSHAHANLIVHRDLKPANIIVTADGVVKLLDFGIAKLMESEHDAAPVTALTEVGGRALTPRYAAPEQVRGEPVTTVTDVYALGVLLFELLTGRHPTAPGRASPPLELARAVLEVDPPRLRDAVTRSRGESADAEAAAVARVTTLDRLRRLFAGDLENVVARALRRDPAERYASVAELAADVGRFLRHEPVSARADSLGYRVRMFVRRHRAAVAAGAVMAAALLGATLFSARQAREARRQRDATTVQAERAQAINRFLGSLLSDLGPGTPVTLEELLRRARRQVDAELSNDPRVAGRMLFDIAALLATSAGEQQVRPLLARADSLAVQSGDAELIAAVRCARAETSAGLMESDAARQALADAHRQLERLASVPPLLVAQCDLAEATLAVAVDHDAERGVEIARRVVTLLRFQGLTHEDVYAEALTTLAENLKWARRPEEAAAVLRELVLAIDAQGRGSGTEALEALANWGTVETDRGMVVRGDSIFRVALARASRTRLDDPVMRSLTTGHGIASVYLGHLDTAETHLRATIAYADSAGDLLHAARGRQYLARTYVDRGDYVRARREIEALDTLHARITMTNLRYRTVRLEARMLLREGEAVRAYARLDSLSRALGWPAKTRFIDAGPILLERSEAALAAGLPAEAERSVRDAARVDAATDTSAAAGGAFYGEAGVLWARARLAQGDTAAAVERLRIAVRGLTVGLGPDHAETRAAEALLSRVRR